MDLVRCNATRPNGEPCMTVFPASTAKAELPCIWCYEERARLQAKKQKLREKLDEVS